MERKSNKEIERSIIKEYRKEIFRKFNKALDEYELIKEGDKIAVCISGGKDSFLLAKCMQEIQKHGNKKFDLEFICMDPGFKEEDMEKILDNAKHMEIPIKTFKTRIFKIAQSKDRGGCYLCARMRRGSLYEIAEKLGCNKIALGHHFTDVTTTTMINILYSGQFKTMMPKVRSTNHTIMELIRPLYFVDEERIKSWAKANGLEFLHCNCPIQDYREANNIEIEDAREKMKALIRSLKEKDSDVEKKIFRATENVNLDMVLGYKKDGKYHDFLSEY